MSSLSFFFSRKVGKWDLPRREKLFPPLKDLFVAKVVIRVRMNGVEVQMEERERFSLRMKSSMSSF